MSLAGASEVMEGDNVAFWNEADVKWMDGQVSCAGGRLYEHCPHGPCHLIHG